MRIPTIQIQQQYAQLGFDVDMGHYEIRQPQATLEIETTPAKLEMISQPGQLEIDQSRAWQALGLGGNLEWMNQIYSQLPQIALQGIAHIVEKGNLLAAIHLEKNAIANIAREEFLRPNEVQYVSAASCDNVDIHYQAHKPQIDVVPGNVSIRTHPNPPEVNYARGKSEFYMKQYGSVTIIPPEIDITV